MYNCFIFLYKKFLFLSKIVHLCNVNSINDIWVERAEFYIDKIIKYTVIKMQNIQLRNVGD